MEGTPLRVVIVGGGFGGLKLAQKLAGTAAQVTLIDRRNFHLFQPLLYQVATGTLSPADIASPLRQIVGRTPNVRVLLGEVVDIDVPGRVVVLANGERLPYDQLILATGASHNYFGHDEWSDRAPGLKTLEDATKIRRRVLTAFELAEREEDPARAESLMTFVIVGAGPTGVELAGALSEIAQNTLRGEFRRIDPARARVILVEAQERVLGSFAPGLAEKTRARLAALGVELRLGWRVCEVAEGLVQLQHTGEEAQVEAVPCFTVLWAAGVQASGLGAILARGAGAEVDRVGRVKVLPDCSVPGHPELFVVGDLAHFVGPTGQPLPGVAQTAMQQGSFVARVIRARMQGGAAPTTFSYLDLGSMAVTGRGHAVAELFGMRLAGVTAWLVWLFIHLMNLIEFENRVLVMIQWARHYLTWNKSARLITGESRPPAAP